MKIERVTSGLSFDVEVGDIIRYRGCYCMIVKQRYPSEGMFPYGVLNLETNEVENNYESLKGLGKDAILVQKNKNVTIKF